jgi:hypothetical protein
MRLARWLGADHRIPVTTLAIHDDVIDLMTFHFDPPVVTTGARITVPVGALVDGRICHPDEVAAGLATARRAQAVPPGSRTVVVVDPLTVGAAADGGVVRATVGRDELSSLRRAAADAGFDAVTVDVGPIALARFARLRLRRRPAPGAPREHRGPGGRVPGGSDRVVCRSRTGWLTWCTSERVETQRGRAGGLAWIGAGAGRFEPVTSLEPFRVPPPLAMRFDPAIAAELAGAALGRLGGFPAVDTVGVTDGTARTAPRPRAPEAPGRPTGRPAVAGAGAGSER